MQSVSAGGARFGRWYNVKSINANRYIAPGFPVDSLVSVRGASFRGKRMSVLQCEQVWGKYLMIMLVLMLLYWF
jgi:hypothetical protein